MKFGVREIVDVVFKAADTMRVGDKIFKKYQPVFMIDTATTSSLEQATTTVYAQGGKGYARLIAWEGEKTMTFTVTDALMSPMGLMVLTGAGLINPAANKPVHVHCTINKALVAGEATVTLEDLIEETGLDTATSFQVCALRDVQPFATKLDGSGAGIDWYSNVAIKDLALGAEFVEVTENKPIVFTVKTDDDVAVEGTVQLDFYLIMNNANAVTEIQIEPSSFGGYFYVEAQTLFRREDTGKDMAAEIIIPKAKVQSAFTFTMAASGDPSTFDFVMDAMPGYTRFDHTKKQMCVIQMLGTDKTNEEEEAHIHNQTPDPVSPVFLGPDAPVEPSIDIKNSDVVSPTAAPASFPFSTEYQANQGKADITVTDNTIAISVIGGVDSLNEWTSTDSSQAIYGDKPWLAVDIDTGIDDITKLTYNGAALTQTDVQDAAAWGLGPGHIILWIKADDVKINPKIITLAGENIDPVTITVTVTDA